MAYEQQCEMGGCRNQARGWVEAQWTIVDFVRYEVCDECISLMRNALQNTKVDGFPPAYVSSDWYTDDLPVTPDIWRKFGQL